MRIAIIGAGVSGNVCAHLLNDSHDVMLFESNGYAGGHTNTVDVEAYGRHFTVDTGFMVFNDRTYPNFVRLLAHLGVASQASDMSFSVRCDRTGWEYQGSSLSGLFAQRRNLFRPAFYRMLCDIVRFNRRATEVRDGLDDGLTLGEFLEGHRYGRHLRSHYLLPMTAAIWSAPPSRILEMPARFLFQFFHNHGLLQLTDRPQWRTISGGARRYVKAMLEPLGDRVRLETPIQAVRRFDDHVTVTPRGGSPEVFDAVVFACHSDQALGMLVDPTTQERELLSQFAYQRNVAILHTDASLMPRRPAAWASWNYHVPLDEQGTVAVTYDLNRLQRLGAPGPICVTLNDCERIAPRAILREIVYQHPVFGPGTLRAQQQHARLNGQNRTYYCGAYWGYGFHEDGVASALAVGRCFGRDLDSCKVASTPDTSDTGASNHSVRRARPLPMSPGN